MRRLTRLCFLIVLAGAVSCRNGIPLPHEAREIEVDASMGQAVKGSGDDGLDRGYTLYLTAHVVDDVLPANNIDYFIARPFTWQADSWKAASPVFWPLGGNRLSFLAVATDAASFDIPSAAVWNDESAANGFDLDIPDNCMTDREVLFGRAVSTKGNNGPVAINMHHSQSCLNFRIGTNYPNSVRIDRIVIKDVYTGGNLRVINSGGYAMPYWNFRGHYRHDMVVPGSEKLVATAEVRDLTVYLPEQASCDLEIHWRRKASDIQTWEDAGYVNTVTYSPKVDSWWYGHKTVYTMDISLDRILFDVEVLPWETENKYI